MVFDLPKYEDVVNRIRADVKRLLPNLDPTIFGSLVRAITDSNAGRHYDNILSIDQLRKELFPTPDSSIESLQIWARYEGITPFSETKASGAALFVGDAGSVIELESEFTSASGSVYIANSSDTIESKSIDISSLTRSGSTVTAITAGEHGLATNVIANISGAVEIEYNGAKKIAVLSLDSFSYEIAETPTSPATGTILVECTCATIDIISDDFGLDQNLDSGAEIISSSTISGVDSSGYVTFLGVTGGFDEETSAELFDRVVLSRANPVANFNPTAIETQAREIQGVTRVKVKRITPDVGDVTVLFVRDNDADIIPSAGEVLEVKDSILEILPATSDESNVYVKAPTAVPTQYVFSSILPSTNTMKDAITENIKAFYRREVNFETTIQEDKYRSAIINTIDPANGDRLSSFDLATPSGDIVVATDEIGTFTGAIF